MQPRDRRAPLYGVGIVSTPAKLVSVSGRRAMFDIAGQLAGRVLNVALGVVVTIVLVRALGDSAFGQWSTILAVVQITGYLGALGLEQIAVRKAAEEPEREHEWIGGLLSLRIALALPVTAISAVVLLLISDSRTMSVASILVVATLLLSGLSSTRAVFQLRVRNSVNSTLELLNGVLWGGAVIALAASDGGLVAFAVAFLAVATITTIVQVVLAARSMPLRVRGTRPQWPELVRVGLPAAIAGMLILAYGRIDQVLVFEIAGPDEAGLYGAAYRILDRAQMIPDTVLATFFPMMAAAYAADLDRLKRLVQLSVEIICTASLPALAFTIPNAHAIAETLFGPEFADAGPTLAILMGAFALIAAGYTFGFMIIVLNMQRRLIVWASAGLVLNVVLNLALIPQFGFVAAAWVTVATEVLVIGLMVRAVLPAIGHTLDLGRLARIAAAATGMGLSMWALGETDLPLWALALAAIAIYGWLLFSLHAWTAEELRQALARRGGEPGA
jgi:O-antigen/teichoic acid export membrane protein